MCVRVCACVCVCVCVCVCICMHAVCTTWLLDVSNALCPLIVSSSGHTVPAAMHYDIDHILMSNRAAGLLQHQCMWVTGDGKHHI